MKKRCFKCSEVLPIGDFYKHPQMADGHLNKCKECTKRDAKSIAPEKRKAYETKRYARPERRAAIRASTKRSAAADPERYKAYGAAYYERNREDILARQRAARRADPSKKAATNRRYDESNPEKRRAHRAVKKALDAGKLERQACKGCGAAKAHAHHDDYSKPLVVTWLCPKCHKQRHWELEAT